MKSQRDSFKAYLTAKEQVSFTFKGTAYRIRIVGCKVYPQGYTAVLDQLGGMTGVNMLADIGNGTMNVMYINDRKPVESKCWTEKLGVEQCVIRVKNAVMDRFGTALDDTHIKSMQDEALDEKTLKRKKKEEFLKNAPKWVMDYNSINEVKFCKWFVERHPMICVGGKLFDVDGEIEQDRLSNAISSEIMRYMMTGISKKVKAIMDALKLYCYREELPLREDEIHLQNGTLRTDGTFTPEKCFCRNRLDVSWRDFGNEPYYPEHFLHFLLGLLDTEDILTLQEYLGYCLIPSTKGQKMLFLVGSGGEGKSRIGVVLQEMFGRNMLTGSFQRIETDRFFSLQLAEQAAHDRR